MLGSIRRLEEEECSECRTGLRSTPRPPARTRASDRRLLGISHTTVTACSACEGHHATSGAGPPADYTVSLKIASRIEQDPKVPATGVFYLNERSPP